MTTEELNKRVESINDRIEKLVTEAEQNTIDSIMQEVSEHGY